MPKRVPLRLSLMEKAEIWFKTKNQNVPPHPRISEFQKLCFFWEDLGLNIFDLNQIEVLMPGWTMDMIEIGLAKRRTMNEAASQEATAPMANQMMGGHQVIRRTLLKDG